MTGVVAKQICAAHLSFDGKRRVTLFCQCQGNQTSATSAGGALTHGFAPTTTLGCGSWGGNSILENLDYKHLMTVSRIGKVISGKAVPTDAEIWA